MKPAGGLVVNPKCRYRTESCPAANGANKFAMAAIR
jgi:hypothetical protein